MYLYLRELYDAVLLFIDSIVFIKCKVFTLIMKIQVALLILIVYLNGIRVVVNLYGYVRYLYVK
jgi:hypothetical protein